MRAGLVADHLRLRQQAEEARLFYVACTRAAEELHVLIAGVDPGGPLRDGSVRCPADWLVGAGLAWDDASEALDAAPARVPLAAAVGGALPALAVASGSDQVVRTVSDLLAATERGEERRRGGLQRAEAQALGIAIHAALASHGPGMAADIAEGVLAPFAAGLGGERHGRLRARLGDRGLLPGYWSAAARLVEQPVIGEHAGGLVLGVCDVLLKDAAGAWRLYDWKTGAAADEAVSREQVRLYARLVAPRLDGPLVAAGLVDVEQGVVIDVELDEA
jgi:hypothetical protein